MYLHNIQAVLTSEYVLFEYQASTTTASVAAELKADMYIFIHKCL
jgi:hypothetical protein